jgi:DNA-binding MarR family transcriptional regulator
MMELDYAKMILDIVPPLMRYVKNEMRVLAKSELTVTQFRVLARLSRSAAANRELAEWIGVSAPTMTRMIDALLHKELVTRIQQSEDRRQIEMKLTAKGQTTFDQIKEAVQRKLAEKIRDLPNDKRKSIADGLGALRDTFL